MGSGRAAGAGLTAAQLMDFWLWLWLGFTEREEALGRRSHVPGASAAEVELNAELVALESVSSRLSAELPPPPPGSPAGLTFPRLQGGLAPASMERLASWLAGSTAPAATRVGRRAAEVLRKARVEPPPSPSRAAAVELWTWLSGAEADRRRLLAGATRDRSAARQLGDELRFLLSVQAGVRRGQPDVIPSHPHEARWLGARQAVPTATAAELARVLRRAHPDMASGRDGARLGQLVDATASRLEALAGPQALAAARAREQAEAPRSTVRGKIAAGLAAAGSEPERAAGRFLGKLVVADASGLGATLVDADLGERTAWRVVITPAGFDEAAEFSAAGAVGYELFVLVGASGALEAVHQRIDRSPHGQRWFAPAPAPGWLHPQGPTLDVAWVDVAAPARARMQALLAALTSGRSVPAAERQLPGAALALAARRVRRSRH